LLALDPVFYLRGLYSCRHLVSLRGGVCGER
jgi:hypothetical protein